MKVGEVGLEYIITSYYQIIVEKNGSLIEFYIQLESRTT